MVYRQKGKYMSNTTSTSSGGLGLLSVLGIIFVVLKLVGVIDWSWWLVLLPFYGGFVLFLAAAVIVLLVGAIVKFSGSRTVRKR
jgi:hypothetical protein